MKKVVSIILALVMVLSVVYVGSPYTYADESGNGTSTKTLKVAFKGLPNGLCHVSIPVGSMNTPYQELMMDRLFDFDSETGQVVPMLATGWEQLSDKTFRITLRDDVYSWNGDKFKASDVLYTIQAAVNSGVHDRYYGNFDVENFVVEDDTHLIIALKNKDAFIQYSLSNIPYGMLCEASVTAGGGLGNMDGANGNMPNCYTGPYIPVEWVNAADAEEKYVRFVKNTNYWGEEPYYDEVIIYAVMDSSARAQSLISGDVDIALEPNENMVSSVVNKPDLDVYALPTTNTYTLFTNTQLAPFDDENFRIACALALDYEGNIDAAINGFGQHSDSILPIGSPQYSSPADDGCDSFFTYDLSLAQEYMANSVYAGTNPTVEIYYTAAFSNYVSLIQQQWAQLGITVVPVSTAQAAFYETIRSGDKQAYLLSNSNANPYDQLKFYDGAHYDYNSLNGGPGWNGGEEVTALFDSITASSSMAAATPYYRQLCRILEQKVPSIPLCSPSRVVFGKKGLTGLKLTIVGDADISKVRGGGTSSDPEGTVNVYVSFSENSMSARTSNIQIDYWRQQYPDKTFNVIYGNIFTIDQFASLRKTDGSAVLISNPGYIYNIYKDGLVNDLSDRTTFKAVSSSVNSVQPQSQVLVCRSDETRFSSLETLVDYISSHPGQIKIGYLEGSQYEFFIKSLLTVLDIAPKEIRLISAANTPELRTGVQSGTFDLIPLSGTMAIADISSGKVKGILHDVLSREGYPFNEEALQDVPILTEISIIDPSDYDNLLIELPNTVYVSAGTPSEICEAINHATDGINDDEEFVARMMEYGASVTCQYYTLEEIDDVQQRAAGHVQRAVAYQPVPVTYMTYGTDQYERNDDNEVYEFVLGGFEDLMAEAGSIEDTDEQFAAYAKAEAELLDSAVIIPTTTNSGRAVSFLATLNLNRGTFALGNGNAASNKTESQKISAAVALSNRNFRKALQFSFDKASYNAVSMGEDAKYERLRNIFTYPELVSLSKQIEVDGHVFEAGTTYGELVQYYLQEAGSHIQTADDQDGWYDPSAAVQALNAAKTELGSAVTYPIVIDYVYLSTSSSQVGQAQAYKQSVESTLGTENVLVDLIAVDNTNDYYSCAYYVTYGFEVDLDFYNGIGWAADNDLPSDFLNCFIRGGYLITDLGLSPDQGSTPSDLPELAIATTDTDNFYDFYESVHVKAWLQNPDGTTTGIAEQYPDAHITLTFVDENYNQVSGFIVQSAGENGNSFPLTLEDMPEGDYIIQAEADFGSMALLNEYRFHYNGYSEFHQDISNMSFTVSVEPETVISGGSLSVTATVTDADGAPAENIKANFQLQYLDDGEWVVKTISGYDWIYDLTDQDGTAGLMFSAMSVSERIPAGTYRFHVWIESVDGDTSDPVDAVFELISSNTGIDGVKALNDVTDFTVELGDSVTLAVDTSSMGDNERAAFWYALDDDGYWALIREDDYSTECPVTYEFVPSHNNIYMCEIMDDQYCSKEIEFYVSINNGLTIAPKDCSFTKYVEAGSEALVEVIASADRGDITYDWFDVTDDYHTYLIESDGPASRLFEDIDARRVVCCMARDMFGNMANVNIEIIPVAVEVNTTPNVEAVATGSEDNNIVGSVVPDEVLDEAVENGQSVTVNIVVNDQDASDIPEEEVSMIEDKIAEAFPGEEGSISYVSIDLNYTVDGGDPTAITETSEVLEITIVVPNAVAGKQYVVIRMHTDEQGNSSAEVIPSTYVYDGETGTGTITIKSDKFSTFAIQQVESFLTVRFDTLGGSAVADKTVGNGGSMDAVPDSVKTGYTFQGWMLGEEDFSTATPITDDLDTDSDGIILLTAKWQINMYNVTFDSQGGSPVAAQEVEYLNKAEEPADPVKEGYVFAGWIGPDGNLFSFNTLIKEDTALTATWRAVTTYPIWFNYYPDNIYAVGDPEIGGLTFYDQETGEPVDTRIQVTSENLDDILRDGGSIKYDPDYNKLTFDDPDFGNSSIYDYGGEYAALVSEDPYYVALVGSAYIPTVYSSDPGSSIVFYGNFSIGCMYNALYSAGYVVVQGGSLYTGCNGTPFEAKELIIYGGDVTADSPMGTSVYIHDRIRVEGGSLTATGGPNNPSIFTGGLFAMPGVGLDGPGGRVKASVFTFPGEDPSSYENMEGLQCRIIALDGFSIDGIGIPEPENGKVSGIQYHTYDEFGNLQPCDAYAVTKADGSASAVVRLEAIADPVMVYFVVDEGSDLPPQLLSRGSTATKPEDPVRGGYAFKGWKLNGEYFDFNTPVTEDITLVADWEEMFVNLKAANLSLEGKISINFKLTSDYEGLVAKLFYEKVDYAEVAEIPLNSDHFVVDPKGGDHYLVSYTEVPAKEMTLNLRIKVFDATGTQIPMKISSGFIDQYDYSVSKWCNNKINQNNNANDVMIAKAILNYGHYTQLALKYNDGQNGRPNRLANPNGYLAEEMANFAGGNSTYDSITTGGAALGAKAFALVLESNTSIKLKLKRQVSVLIDGTPAVLTQETDNDGSQIWSVFKTDVAAKRLHEKAAFKLTEGSNSATIYYGALSWANKKLTGTDVNDKNLAKAMYLYNYAARKYFNYDAAGLQ